MLGILGCPHTSKRGNLLPSENTPEIVLFYVHSKNQWYKEYIDDLINNGININVLLANHFSSGIDTKKDLALVKKIYKHFFLTNNYISKKIDR